jgi:hypothetical protein
MVMMKKSFSFNINPLATEGLTKNNSYQKIRHPKLGCYFTSLWLDLDEIFVKRPVLESPDRHGNMYDYGCYATIDTSKEGWVILPHLPFPIRGALIYIGKGVINISQVEFARALCHDLGDAMSKYILNNSNVCIFMLGWGMTCEESEAYEALLINESGLKLSKYGCDEWKEGYLLNKKSEPKSLLNAYEIIKPWK